MINTKTATISELRTFATTNNIHIDGDRRKKAVFIEAIEAWLNETGFYDNEDDEILAAIVSNENVLAINDNDISIDELTNLPDDFDDITIEELDSVRQYVSNSDSYYKAHPIYGKNPNFLKEKSEQQGMTMSQISQEYELNFQVEESNVFSTDEIMKLTDTEVLPESESDCESLYWAGLDVAYGNSGDYLVCCIFKTVYNLMPDGSTNEQYHLVAQYRKNKNTMSGYVYDLVELFNQFNVWMVSYESNAGGKLVADELERLNHWSIEAMKVSTTLF